MSLWLGILSNQITAPSESTDIALAHNGFPYITAYPWSNGFGTKYADPSTLPSATAFGTTFSTIGSSISVAHQSSPYITAYPFSGGFGTKYANPSTLPANTGRTAAFSLN